MPSSFRRQGRAMELTLTIGGTLPGLNDYIKQLNISKFRGAELKRKTEKQISAHIRKQLKGACLTGPADIAISWIEPNRKRDKDNISSAKKFIFDALVKNKVLQNDGWANIGTIKEHFSVDPKHPRVVVMISGAE